MEQLYALTEINDKFDFGRLQNELFYLGINKNGEYECHSGSLIKSHKKYLKWLLLPIEVKTVSDQEIINYSLEVTGLEDKDNYPIDDALRLHDIRNACKWTLKQSVALYEQDKEYCVHCGKESCVAQECLDNF